VSGKFSTVIVIPVEIARKLGIDKPSNVIVEETKKEVLIKKLNI
jgi:bifunctional DNA-binding transcriptional regulator/antitoxin component of YhaV-PrlF toxin-antitoxin module